MTSTLIQQWLRQVLGPYPSKDLLYRDVDGTLAAYPTLRPKTDVYTFDDGRQQLLLCIHGLVPITFRQSTYNIPVAIWLTLNYPREPPIAYVVPTSDMLVKASKDVDISGKCRLEYLAGWERKSEGCTLKMLIEAMQDVFSRDPPVYAKPRAQTLPPSVAVNTQPAPIHTPPPPQQHQHPSTITSAPPPVPPTPMGYQSPLSAPAFSSDGRPLLPPKPSTSTIFSPPAVVEAVAFSPTPANLVNRPPPPLPPGPIQSQPITPSQSPQRPLERPPPPPWAQAFQSASPIQSPASPGHRSSSSATSFGPQYRPPLHMGASPDRPPPPVPVPHYSVPGSIVSTPSPLPPPMLTGQFHSIQSQHPYGPPQSPAPPPPPPQVAFSAVQQPPPAALTPAPNLLDADDDTGAMPAQVFTGGAFGPPRPMNPELLRLHDSIHQKISSELHTFTTTVTEDGDRLRATQADLLQGEPAIRDEMARLVAVRDVCRSVADRLRDTVQAAETNVMELRRKGEPELDELVCSTTIVYNQLINLVAEDNAIEDTIYHLGRALNSGRIDLDRFIRTTRVLAEEQFMKRALIQKITSGMAGASSMGWS